MNTNMIFSSFVIVISIALVQGKVIIIFKNSFKTFVFPHAAFFNIEIFKYFRESYIQSWLWAFVMRNQVSRKLRYANKEWESWRKVEKKWIHFINHERRNYLVEGERQEQLNASNFIFWLF